MDSLASLTLVSYVDLVCGLLMNVSVACAYKAVVQSLNTVRNHTVNHTLCGYASGF